MALASSGHAPVKINVLKHGAILYNKAEVFSLPITNPNGRPMLPFDWIIHSSQEIIKVREWIPNIGPLSKVIPHKLFLDMVPSSSEDVTRTLCECFPGGSVYAISFCFKATQNL